MNTTILQTIICALLLAATTAHALTDSGRLFGQSGLNEMLGKETERCAT